MTSTRCAWRRLTPSKAPGRRQRVTVLIERSSISNWPPGQRIVVRTPNGQPRELRVSGLVHDAGQAPGWQDGVDYGYITLDTLAALGESRSLDELRIVVAEKPLDVQHIQEVAYQAKGFLEQRDLAVSQVIVPKPGQHPHTDQMNSLLFLLEAFGVLALALSGILVATIMAALLAQQIRQIGVMKAVGARTGQYRGRLLWDGPDLRTGGVGDRHSARRSRWQGLCSFHRGDAQFRHHK